MKKLNPELTKEYDENNTPMYEHVNDTLLIGVVHSANARKNKKKLKRFVDSILFRKHLIIEGNSFSFKEYQNAENFENIAYKKFRGRSINHLEEGAKIAELCDKYGLRKDLYGLYNSFDIFPNALIEHSGSSNNLLNAIKEYTLIGQEANPNDGRETPEFTSSMLVYMLNKEPDSFVTAMEIGPRIKSFRAKVREHEVLIPNLLELNESLDGRKAVIVGATHIEGMKRGLTGEELVSPVTWGEYVQTLEPKYKEFIGTLETVVFPQ